MESEEKSKEEINFNKNNKHDLIDSEPSHDISEKT